DDETDRDQLFGDPSVVAAVRVETGHDDDDAACAGVGPPRANEEGEPSCRIDPLFSGRAKLSLRHNCLLVPREPRGGICGLRKYPRRRIAAIRRWCRTGFTSRLSRRATGTLSHAS